MRKLKLNSGQEKIVQEAVDWYFNSSEQVFQISGPAGSGKSTVLLAIIQRIGIPMSHVLPMSYVGAAALNMRLKGLYNAKTIHSALYELVDIIKTDSLGNVIMDKYLNRPILTQVFRPRELINNYSLLIVDEAGMVPSYMRKDILHHNIKVLAVGDLNQLPSIDGSPAFLYTGEVHFLTEIMRQGVNSSIIELSQRAINGLPIHTGYYPNDVLVIDYDDLTSEMIMSSNMVICGKNNTRDFINNKVRKEILGIHSEIPICGERVMCVKNDWNEEVDGINLVNGLTGIVLNNPDVSNFDGKSFRMDFMPDYGNGPFVNLPIDYEYITSLSDQRKKLKNRNYSNGELFEYAYASTCHKAQGMTIPRVVYLEEYLNRDIQNNLNYTAITRASQGLIYVKQKRKFF
jgi:exodeoxyribonuclease-5